MLGREDGHRSQTTEQVGHLELAEVGVGQGQLELGRGGYGGRVQNLLKKIGTKVINYDYIFQFSMTYISCSNLSIEYIKYLVLPLEGYNFTKVTSDYPYYLVIMLFQ